MNRMLCILLAVALSGVSVWAEALSLASPDGKLTIRIEVEGDIRYSIAYDGEEVVASSGLGLMLDGVPLPRPSRSIPPVEAEHDGVVKPVVPRKMASIPDRYRELRIPLDGGHQLQFRAYDDGAAYRFVTGAPGQVEVTRETVELNFPVGSRSLFPEEESILSHNVTIPYIRMAAGPMDYTPGAMVNAQPHNFRDRFERPMSMGTRAHEVAKYVVYESPLQMLCDSPSLYRREAETTAYISRIPTVWDSTQVLEGEVGEYILVARSRDGEWYVAAMTNEEERTLTVIWSFLPAGTYDVEVFADGINAHRHAEDYRVSSLEIRPGNRTEIRLAPGGGWVGVARRR